MPYLSWRRHAPWKVRSNLHAGEAFTKLQEYIVMGVHLPGEKVDLSFSSVDVIMQLLDIFYRSNTRLSTP